MEEKLGELEALMCFGILQYFSKQSHRLPAGRLSLPAYDSSSKWAASWMGETIKQNQITILLRSKLSILDSSIAVHVTDKIKFRVTFAKLAISELLLEKLWAIILFLFWKHDDVDLRWSTRVIKLTKLSKLLWLCCFCYLSPIILVFWQSTLQTMLAKILENSCGGFCGWNFNSPRRKFGSYFLVSFNCVSRLSNHFAYEQWDEFRIWWAIIILVCHPCLSSLFVILVCHPCSSRHCW